jgi:thiol-disulfide isomerase/thioredoxin
MTQTKRGAVRKLILPVCTFILLSLPFYGMAQQSSSSIQIYLFYAEDCPACGGILQGYLPGLKSMYPFLEIQTFDLADPTYYEALSRLEKKFNRRGSELPVLFIGDQVLSGEKEIMERLDPLILDYQIKGAPTLPPLQTLALAKPPEKAFSVELAYFYQKGCPKCDRANLLLKYILKKYPRLDVKQIDLNTSDGKRFNETLSNRLNLPAEKRLIAPSIFVGNNFLSPEEITEENVEVLIRKYGDRVSDNDSKKTTTLPSLSPTPEEAKKAEETIAERFRSLGIFAILAAGLIEGLNPCAFATLIFFISYLTMVGRKRKEIFWVGMGFAGTGFFTHLLLGLGLLSFVQHLSFLPLFSRIVYLITFLFALFLGILSLYDYIQLKRGRPSKMKLQVPNFLKKRIHQTIRKTSGNLEVDGEGQSVRLLIAAIIIGFVVTLLQFTCTSQVYLPTILFVTNIPSLRGSAVFYLVLYNLIYIAPLLVIFGIVYWGVTSEQLSFFLQKRASTIKLLTSLFFFALAGILILNFI